MGIDGVGKPGPGVPPTAVGDAVGAAAKTTGEGFRVEAGAEVRSPEGSEALERLGRGELSLEEYLDVRVAEATEHLAGKLPAEQLDFVRETLREQLRTDPVLVELVRRSTGTVPA